MLGNGSSAIITTQVSASLGTVVLQDMSVATGRLSNPTGRRTGRCISMPPNSYTTASGVCDKESEADKSHDKSDDVAHA